MRILVVDDSPEYIELLEKLILSVHDDAIIESYNFDAPLIPLHHPDLKELHLIFLDYYLSENTNAIDILNYLGELDSQVPVIVLTGEDNSRIAVDSLKAGAVDYMVKSEVTKVLLSEKILEAFDYSSRRENLQKAQRNRTLSQSNQSISNEVLFESEQVDNNSYIDVPGYRILKEIGQGGMSTVYLARRVEDNKKIVLKVMFTDGKEDPQALKRFMQEYSLISCLEHPHVIGIYERAFGYNFAYIAMEYFPNGDLSQRVDDGLPPGVSINYLIQILKGLQAIHELDVVHRDLKPANILFKDDANLTITDFGAAKSLSIDKKDITIENVIVGTPYYMSPEQATSKIVDSRSDIYSIGVIFFQMLTGDRPFKGKTISELIRAHLKSPIPKLEGSLSRYQPMLEGLLAKNPDERFQSANDVMLAIDWL